MNTIYTQKNQREGGYAILFAVVIVSIISIIALGLSTTTYKQLILSSLASDSQASFYQSDTATECALYADNVLLMDSSYGGGTWKCGKDTNGQDMTFTIHPVSGGGVLDYQLTSSIDTQPRPCFDFDVTKVVAANTVTTIKARGYNSCDKTNQKTVQREIQVKYTN